jgi:hypothetical protein
VARFWEDLERSQPRACRLAHPESDHPVIFADIVLIFTSPTPLLQSPGRPTLGLHTATPLSNDFPAIKFPAAQSSRPSNFAPMRADRPLGSAAADATSHAREVRACQLLPESQTWRVQAFCCVSSCISLAPDQHQHQAPSVQRLDFSSSTSFSCPSVHHILDHGSLTRLRLPPYQPRCASVPSTVQYLSQADRYSSTLQ